MPNVTKLSKFVYVVFIDSLDDKQWLCNIYKIYNFIYTIHDIIKLINMLKNQYYIG